MDVSFGGGGAIQSTTASFSGSCSVLGDLMATDSTVIGCPGLARLPWRLLSSCGSLASGSLGVQEVILGVA